MNKPITEQALDSHLRAREYATFQLAYLSMEDTLALAYDALYYSAAATIAAADPRSQDSPYAAGYIRACRDILHTTAGSKLTIDDLRNPNE